MLQKRGGSFRNKTAIKTWQGLLLSCLAVFISVLTSAPANAEGPGNRNILMIFSWHKNLPWQLEIEKGFNLHYRSISSKPNLFYEYMDAGRFKGQKQIDIFKIYLHEKYADYSIDSVIFEGPPAAKLLISYPELFKNSNKYALTPGALQTELSADTSTVIPANTDYESALKALLQASQGKKIYLVAGSTPHCKERVLLVSGLISRLDPDKKIIPLNGLPMDELLEKVSALNPADSIILFLLFFKDADGVRYTPYEAVKLISQRAGAPVYSAWTSLLGSGIVGGYLLSGERLGREVAAILASPNDVRTMDSNQLAKKFHGFFYDWRQLKRWDIPEESLPAGSRILFRKQTFYELYFKEIVAGSLAIVLVISFFWNLILRKEIKARLVVEENLLESENRFHNLSDATFEGIIISDKGKVLDANQSAAKMRGCSVDALIGMNTLDLVRPGDRDKVKKKIALGYDRPYEIWAIRQDGIQFPVEVHAKTYLFKGKRVRVTAVRDLTEKKKAEEEIRALKGILPICSYCKEIRDDKGYWNQLESYIAKHSDAEFSHSICPKCAKKFFPDMKLYDK